MACGMLSGLKNSIVTKDLEKLDLPRGVTHTNKQKIIHYIDYGPTVYSRDVSNKDIKAATNFQSENEMMAYIIIVCNGDWEQMKESVTGIMTWFEEWYFYFEFIWGRILITWNVVTMKKVYGMKELYLRITFGSKLRMMLCARES